MSNNSLYRFAGWSAYVSAGSTICGESHPLTYVGGMASIIGYPTWVIWLGRKLLSRH